MYTVKQQFTLPTCKSSSTHFLSDPQNMPMVKFPINNSANLHPINRKLIDTNERAAGNIACERKCQYFTHKQWMSKIIHNIMHFFTFKLTDLFQED